MFTTFLYNLRGQGVPVGTGEWLAFLDALGKGLAVDLEGLYGLGRALLCRTEADYDGYDLAFAGTFRGLEVPEDLRQKLEEWLRGLSLNQIYDLVDELDEQDLAFLQEGVVHNLRLAEYGLKYGSGLGIGKAIDRLIKQKVMVNDMATSARRLTSAAADARMGGAKLPAMSSAGSGNHGLTAILPIWAAKDFVDVDRKTALKAIGLSHIITAYVKAHTGRLSAVCGCSVAAGAGATAGITYLVGGDVKHMAGAIKNIVEDLAGVICDGAKAGCALKLNTAAGAAVQAALFSLQGINVKDTDGIVGISPENTVQNMGKLSHQGMVETDKTILKIMLEKQEARKR